MKTTERQAVAAAAITLIWFPGMTDAVEGQVIDPVIVSTDDSDAQGQFRLTAKPTAAMLAEASRNDGWINFDMTVSSSAGIMNKSFSRAWQGNTWSTKDRKDLANSLDVQYVYDSDGRLINGTERTAAAQAVAATAYGCQYVVDSTWRQSTRLGQFHTASNGDGSWQYGSTADSDIDTGAKAYGAAGWSVSGSVHLGNSSSATIDGYTTSGYHKWIRSDFRYRLGHIRDYFGAPAGSGCNGSGMHVGDQFTSATSWAGGIADDTGSGASDRGCTQQPMASYRGTYPPNTGLYLGSSRATRVSFAIDLSFMNLGGTSGYSTHMDMGWKSKRGKGLWLCGVTGDEAANPGIVHAQNIP